MAGSRTTKYVVRNNLGSILATFDDEIESKDFMKKHVMACYVEKVTISTEIVANKLKNKDDAVFNTTNWFG